MALNEPQQQESEERPWYHRYLPLAAIAAALLIVLAVLPSALTLPQSDPSEVPEYAPVPPDENVPPPSGSNLAALSLSQSGGIRDEAPTGKLPDTGIGANPTIYDCVEGRQTEDALSPPCSPFFSGDNGGATYQGVTADEVRVIWYMDGSLSTDKTASYDAANEIAPIRGTYCDADLPPNVQKKCANESGVDHLYLRFARAFQRYLNSRYQTYGRHIHFWVYFGGATDAGGRRSEAADNFAKIKPFAVIDWAIFRGYSNAYIDAMARNGVMVLASEQINPRGFYKKYNPLVWSYLPDVEQQVDHYVEYVCKKVVPYPVAHSGPGIARGEKRKYAFYYTTDLARPDLLHFKKLALPRLRSECGVDGIEATFPTAGYTINTGGDPAYARLNIARLQGAGVTTMLWLGGIDGKTEQAGDDARYYPEVFYAGDAYMEGGATGFYANRNFHAQVAVETFIPREGQIESSNAYQAWRQAEPNAPNQPEARWVTGVYRNFFMVGLAVQVAGPRLHPTTVEEGFRAIPTIQSTSPFVPSCFFTISNTCVQDATQVWWDNEGVPPGGTNPGCYRTPHEGRRYILGNWPKGDDVFRNPNDPCSAYSLGARANIGVPGFEE